MRGIWRALRHRSAWERDLEAELRDHVERRAEDLARHGMPPEAALRQARLELGSRESFKEQCRAAHGLRWPDELRQDLRYAFRTLLRSPGFAAVAVLSLALGLGANTVVFSVVNALLLRPLPVTAPENLYCLQGDHYPAQSFPNYRDLRDRNTAFSGLAAYRMAPIGLEAGDGARRVWGYLATGNYFELLGVRPALGRFFTPAEDRAPGASPFAVLSYDCWRSRFAGDPQVVGKAIRLNGLPYTVLGVAPPGFQGTELFYWPEIWVPMMMEPQIEGHSWLDQRATFNAWVIGRLKPDVSRQQADANLRALAAELAREYPRTNEALHIKLAPPGLAGDIGRAAARAFMGGVMGLALLVLLAACANLASLLAARASDRFRELAIRLSIGAGRGRIVRQLLTEAVLLAALGGTAGYGLAVLLLRMLSGWKASADFFPMRFAVDADARVFAFAVLASLATGLLFGIAPARQAWRADANQALKGMPSGAGAGRRWASRDLLLAAQLALCCLLVTASFVSLRGLLRAVSTPLGFQLRGLSMVNFDLGLARYNHASAAAFQKRSVEVALRLPGVTAAAYANSVPLSLDQSTTTVFREDATDFRLNRGQGANYYEVSPGFFRTLGTRLLAGRDFTWHDDRNAPRVAIVNETFARRVVGTRDAVGKRFRQGEDKSAVEIVGVVEDGKYSSLTEQPRPVVFWPMAQDPNPTTVLLARSTLPESEVAGALRQVVAALDPRLPVYAVGGASQTLGLAFVPARAATVALGAFGLLSIMLAVTGIYGLAAYTVSRRAREIGIRVAVGASPPQVLRFVLGRTALLVAIGSGAGLALGMAAAQVLSSIVYQASARDPLILLAVAVTMALIGIAAALAPARRALSMDPLQALRHE